MKKKFEGHTYLKEEIDSETQKLYYFRYAENDMNYECEKYIYKNRQVLDLIYGESSKEYFDKISAKSNIKGISPSVYYEYKGMGMNSFGEAIVN